ncbi:DNA methylase [Catellatospora coxensis]|uniref:DNA (Cytosine-5)-methyltransferase 1 n=1 Tax=Catellatospora coxensis TaxID=310354 RepID=A0A8J3KQL2_9ACTN|nr:DNA methylase [Catellatospora coxensis]GIG04438.1 hypothetical protein Cco03nite_11380 [Catellatospora coxensis]
MSATSTDIENRRVGVPATHRKARTEPPRLLDLFCCAGGATHGYQRAGWHVTGVDLVPRPDYCGDEFIAADAVSFVRAHGHEFDAIHASPPCQDHSTLTRSNRKRTGWTDGHVNLIPPTRAALLATGRPWVMENVVGAPLRPDLVLCGLMFDLRVFRHRVFELHGFAVFSPAHRTHRGHRVAGWRHGVRHDGDMVAVYGDGGGKGTTEQWQAAMGIDWTADREAIAQAIPPAFAHYIGEHLMAAVGAIA